MLRKLICTALLGAVVLSCLSACGKKSITSSSPTSQSTAAEETLDGVDLTDPENSEIKNENGESVEAELITEKQGLARGIDVSKWQGAIDWKSVRASGVDFAIIRIGFRGENGAIYKDAAADYNLQQAEKAGILTGVYFFSTAVNAVEALEEAKWVLEAVKGYAISYPIVYDCEGFNSQSSRMFGIDAAARTGNALAFLKQITSSGYEAMLYASKNDLENSSCWETERIENSYKIMLARYTSPAYPQVTDPGYTGQYAMWQYTNRGIVSGISGNTDLIVSYFVCERAEPKDKAQRPDTAQRPQGSTAAYQEAADEVTAKLETNLRDAAGAKSNIVAAIKNGEFVKRTGIGSNGWSRLEYNGKTVYAITSYLTTDRTPTASAAPADDGFTAAGGKVTAKEETNLRDKPSTSGALVATIRNGELVTRTGTSPKGWSRLEYNGQTVYAKTSLLTAELSSASENSSSQPVGDGYSPVNELVTAKIEVNLRTEPTSKSSSQVVYTLKNGELLKRTGIGSSGWSRLEYNGQTVYAISSYLLTQAEYEAAAAAQSVSSSE